MKKDRIYIQLHEICKLHKGILKGLNTKEEDFEEVILKHGLKIPN